MNTNELRIGNIVNSYYAISDYLSPYSEPPMVRRVIRNPTELGDASFYYPVELTDEWLLMFGFEKKGNQWELFSENKYAVFIEVQSIGYCYRVNSLQIREIKSVHHLQNLFFALTGEELKHKTI